MQRDLQGLLEHLEAEITLLRLMKQQMEQSIS